jgi:hypothetical protein
MAKFPGRRADVGADLDMHYHWLHEAAQSTYVLDVVAHKQDSDAYRLRCHGASLLDFVTRVKVKQSLSGALVFVS